MGETAECSSYAGPVNQVKLGHESHGEEYTPYDLPNTIGDLVQPGAVIAVYTDDAADSYYLLKCTEARHTTISEQTDNWGNTFQAGTDVFTGLYFDKQGLSVKLKYMYKLLKHRYAIVPFAAVRYVCIGMDDDSGKLKLTDEIHHEIMSSL